MICRASYRCDSVRYYRSDIETQISSLMGISTTAALRVAIDTETPIVFLYLLLFTIAAQHSAAIVNDM